jgi:hypothetical protein
MRTLANDEIRLQIDKEDFAGLQPTCEMRLRDVGMDRMILEQKWTAYPHVTIEDKWFPVQFRYDADANLNPEIDA